MTSEIIATAKLFNISIKMASEIVIDHEIEKIKKQREALEYFTK